VSSDDVRCTDTELRLLRPLDEMSTPLRHAATRWLWDHGITPSAVAIGLGIERDPAQHLLVWREEQADGRIIKRWRFAAHDDDMAHWPAAFPTVLVSAGERRVPRAEPAATGATC
jgi:hypothetical protein